MLETLNTTWARWSEALTTPSLQLFLLIGSAALAISLLVLALTRIGQSRPVMKCVILSVIAHILLLGYCYGTRLIQTIPQTATVPSKVTVVGVQDEPLADTEPDPARVEPKPWDLPEDAIALPDASPLAAPELNSEIIVRRTWEVPDDGKPVTHWNDVDVPRLSTESETAATPRLRPEELDHREGAWESPTLEPLPIEIVRRGNESMDSLPNRPSSSVEALTEQPRLAKPSAAPSSNVADAPTSIDEIANHAIEPLLDELVVPDAVFREGEEVAGELAASPMRTASGPIRNAASSSSDSLRQPRRLGDGRPVPKLYRLRLSTDLNRLAKSRGGSEATQAAVERALRWLARNQQSDGRWDPRKTGAGREDRILGHDRRGAGARADMGITALATLALMGAGNTHLEGKYQTHVQHALEFLVRNQRQDGCLAGQAELFARMYCHSMALLALSEALAVTGDERLRGPVERGVQYSVRSQNALGGGWRYQPGDRGDMSQFGWQVMALHSASIGGVTIPQATVDGMHRFLERCATGQRRGLASYRPGQGPSTTMTAESLVCRYFLQERVDEALVGEAELRLLAERPVANEANLYYWYYATMALYHGGGDAWYEWNQQLTRVLVPMQVEGGRDSGSWSPTGMWAGYGGRVYSTAMAALCLEVYYRYLPIHEVKTAKNLPRGAGRR